MYGNAHLQSEMVLDHAVIPGVVGKILFGCVFERHRCRACYLAETLCNINIIVVTVIAINSAL